MNDEGIEIVQGEEKAQCGWKNILKVCSSKKNVLIYSGKRNAFVLPKEAIGEQYEYACNFSAKKYAQKESEIMIIETNSEKETFELGKKIGENAKAGQIYTLTGDLGVGKTVFTQGLAAGLGITEPVNSPTFTIVQMYEDGRLPFYHFDVYRIGDIEEMEEIGYEDCFYGEGVCLIEWADLIQEILPPDVIAIEIEKNLEKGFDYRKITISDPEEKKTQL